MVVGDGQAYNAVIDFFITSDGHINSACH
jgi:hypothetical protein